MTPEIRRAVAFIVGRLGSSRRASAVYDYSQQGYTHFSGTIGPKISIFDHGRSSHITGTPTALFDYKTTSNINIHMNGKNFTGFDFGSSSNFSGTVNQANVQIFDYSASKYFHYFLN